MSTLEWANDRIGLAFEWHETSPVRLVRISDPRGSAEQNGAAAPRQALVEIHTPLWGRQSNSLRYEKTGVGAELRYSTHRTTSVGATQTLEIVQTHTASGLIVTSTFEARADAPAVKAWTSLRLDRGHEPLVVWAVSSFATGAMISEALGDIDVWRSNSTWIMENRWERTPLRSPGLRSILPQTRGEFNQGVIAATTAGSRSSDGFNPVGAVENRVTGQALAWQIEHNGAWHWEVGEKPGPALDELAPQHRLMDENPAGPLSRVRPNDEAYVCVLGPTDALHQWSTVIDQDAVFESVPVSFSVGDTVEDALNNLTTYRRMVRRSHAQNESLPVVFNDYMNTLRGDPTEQKLLPLIDAASRAGAEYFCIDAGWYDDSAGWWASVGDWLPSTKRFPSGLGTVIEHIRTKGMTPGLWLEPEVVGANSMAAHELPEDAFLQRQGTRVREHDRFFLDLRHPAAIDHLNSSVDRLIRDFNVGYFKFDYNVTPGPGTDVGGVSPGAGLLEHNRAVLSWLKALLDRHPSLVIENCAAGGMRTDFGLLSQLQLQSTSDQQDPLLNPFIAVGALGHILPEQAANWAYPQPDMTDEEIIFTMSAGLAGRLYLAGVLDRMTAPQLELVAAGVDAHKATRTAIATADIKYPTGFPRWDRGWVSVAFAGPQATHVLAWKLATGDGEIQLDLSHISADSLEIEQIYPPRDKGDEWGATWSDGHLTLTADEQSTAARMYKLTPSSNTNS